MTTRKNPHLLRETQRTEVQQLELEHDPRQLEMFQPTRIRAFAFEAEGDDETVAAALATLGAVLERGGR